MQHAIKGLLKLRHLRTIIGTLGCFSLLAFATDMTLAAEKQLAPKELSPSKPNDAQNLGKKGGGGTPAPPSNPYCVNGYAGPIEHSTEQHACKVNGQSGAQSCYVKRVQCLSGIGEAQYASTQNCGPCVAVKGQPGQTQTPSGR